MSYTKHTWVDGELVTAAKMNNIENGIEEASSGGGVLVVHDEDGTLDKTYKEIADAGFCVRDVLENDGLHTITPISSFAFAEGHGGMVMFMSDSYICSAENEYPVIDK